MKTNMSDVVAILKVARQLLDRPDNDFGYSRWRRREDACKHCDMLIDAIERQTSTCIDDVKFLFAPTGSMQEVSISSGWGREFIELSARCDKALANLK